MSYDVPSHRQQVSISAGTAFKLGFFGFFGAFVASLIVSIIVFGILLIAGAAVSAWLTGAL